MSEFLTVKAAAKLTGKSPSSVRRILYPIIQDDQHPDRSHIQPGVDEAMTLRMKGENFAWRVSEELLLREIPPENRSEKASESSTRDASGDGGALVAMLQRELDIKNEQITQQMALISGLSERLREGNILMGSLQQQLALTDGRGAAVPRTVVRANPKASPIEKGNATSSAAETPKRGLFRRLFR